jgi:hypothetical protein
VKNGINLHTTWDCGKPCAQCGGTHRWAVTDSCTTCCSSGRKYERGEGLDRGVLRRKTEDLQIKFKTNQEQEPYNYDLED